MPRTLPSCSFQTSAGATAAALADPPSRPPPLSLEVLVSELASGQLLASAKQRFPAVPWGPAQLAQVMTWSAALAVVGAASTLSTPQAAALGATELQGAAVRHLGLEVLCCCITTAILFMGLRRSKPRAAGHFQFDLEPGVAMTVVALAAVAYPLADHLLYSINCAAEEALSLAGQLPDPGAALVAQLRQCAEAGDGASLAMHFVASCFVGPLWEETFWRGFFLASMTRVLPLPACLLLSSGSFALLHLGPGTLLPVAALSAVCDALYLRSGSLAAPLLFHAGWNGYQLGLIVLAGKEAFVYGSLAAPLLFHAGWNGYQLGLIVLAGKEAFV
ncbi:hypothetical protein TSOC_007521 [Tetrabaena socialis]|uniref:CAAX prenyl protease 2/Lysostaphin resistance protein A-like domain-containing protein n=1 Tax=Tetrabaena socialis TaxID=47790 RepID=A0A2J8A0T9_9CHLO|nr:hypothetical protein TSOC_007521 [Tetrabaena socialis]|eukprot:PNH06137.1 hypothetical protein TSOC_007521 [Tetrabaena socialis]